MTLAKTARLHGDIRKGDNAQWLCFGCDAWVDHAHGHPLRTARRRVGRRVRERWDLKLGYDLDKLRWQIKKRSKASLDKRAPWQRNRFLTALNAWTVRGNRDVELDVTRLAGGRVVARSCTWDSRGVVALVLEHAPLEAEEGIVRQDRDLFRRVFETRRVSWPHGVGSFVQVDFAELGALEVLAPACAVVLLGASVLGALAYPRRPFDRRRPSERTRGRVIEVLARPALSSLDREIPPVLIGEDDGTQEPGHT
jgi:hypothetical protein